MRCREITREMPRAWEPGAFLVLVAGRLVPAAEPSDADDLPGVVPYR